MPYMPRCDVGFQALVRMQGKVEPGGKGQVGVGLDSPRWASHCKKVSSYKKTRMKLFVVV